MPACRTPPLDCLGPDGCAAGAGRHVPDVCCIALLIELRASYVSISGGKYLAALDLVCSDGVTVLDPGAGSAARAGLAVSTTPAAASGALLTQVSATFSDVVANLRAGSEVVQADTVLSCSSGYGFLGARMERWAAGQNGTLGTQYKGAAK